MKGFAFGPVYFYSSSTLLALATREDDSQWTDFVRWITWSTIYAEEEGIQENTVTEMPVVELFGTMYRLMFRDVIYSLGNYGEMYARTVEA
jgi:hypothetical protein